MPMYSETNNYIAVKTGVEEIVQLIDSLKPHVAPVDTIQSTDLDKIETVFDLALPSSYRSFLLKYGTLSYQSVRIIGIGGASEFTSLASVLIGLRIVRPNCPSDLVPIEDLGSGWLAGLRCSTSSNENPTTSVVRLYLDALITDNSFTPIAPDFADYLLGRLREIQGRAKGWQQLKKRVAEFNKKHEYDHAKGGKLPRNHVWRPYRYCIQDVVFGTVVVRHERDSSALQVDVFLPVDVANYEPDAAAQALTLFVLSEAYKCGGTMEIEFTNNVEGGHIPASIKRLAFRHGVQLSQTRRLLPLESRQLYAALTDFSTEIRAVLEQLQKDRRLSIERACYAIHSGVWSQQEAETIILASRYPDSVLGGDALPEQRHIYLQDLQGACAAILGGILDRRLAMKEHQDELGVTYNLEDDVRHIRITFDPSTYAKWYVSSEDLPIPWIAGESGGENRIVPANTSVTVLVRARDAARLKVYMHRDLLLAQQLRLAHITACDESPIFILVPADFYELGSRVEEFINSAKSHHIGILVCPESMVTLTENAAKRLNSSRVIRDD